MVKASAKGSILAGTISFESRGNVIPAYLTRPRSRAKRPAVIVIHEIWGLVDHMKDIADRFARKGYVALAPDLYANHEHSSLLTPANIREAYSFRQTIPPEKMGDSEFLQQELSKLPREKRSVMQAVMQVLFERRPELKTKATGDLVNAAEYLRSCSFVMKEAVGSVGFCMGGGLSINLACHTPTAACIVFYGENPSPIELVEKIQCPILGLYGGEDLRINQSLYELVAASVKYKKDFEMRIYKGAQHAFFNDTSKSTYREEAARDAWDRTLRFFSRTLSPSR